MNERTGIAWAGAAILVLALVLAAGCTGPGTGGPGTVVTTTPSPAVTTGIGESPTPEDPVHQFFSKNRVQALKPHLGTEPRVLYAGIDKEVR